MSSQWMGQHGAQPPNAGQIPVVTSILKDFSAEALGELRTWLEQNPPSVSITSILGFSQFTANHSEVQTRESTTSATYADLATVGPSIEELGSGTYFILYGSGSFGNNANISTWLSIDLNSAGASDADACRVDTAAASDAQAMVRGLVKTFSGASNTITMKYKSGDGVTSMSFENRWLIAIKIANA